MSSVEEVFNVISAIGAFILAGFLSVKVYNRVNNRRSSGNSDVTDRATEYDQRITELKQRTDRAVSKLQQKISNVQKMDDTDSN